eukprot:8972825-Pyramimonas_sp.AAC.1
MAHELPHARHYRGGPMSISMQLQPLVRLPRTFAQATALERLGPGRRYEENGEHSLSMTIQRLVLAYYMYLEVKTHGVNGYSYQHHLGARLAAIDLLNIAK